MKARIKSTGEIIDVMAVISGNMDFTNVRCYPEDDIEIINSQHPEATQSEEQRELLNKLADEYAADNSIRVSDRCHDAVIEECVYKAYLAGAKPPFPPQPEATISGWVARDQPINHIDKGNLTLFVEKPTRDYFDYNDLTYGFWADNEKPTIPLSVDLFPFLTWQDEPIEVEITIKPKKR